MIEGQVLGRCCPDCVIMEEELITNWLISYVKAADWLMVWVRDDDFQSI